MAHDWNLALVRAPKALRALPRLDGRVVGWGDVRVTYLDTGYTDHPCFGFRAGERPWLLPERGLDVLDGGLPRDPLDYEGNPGHGTRTCSILCREAAETPGEPPVGSEIGVAPRLPVVPCRVVDSVVLLRQANRQAVADGIRHAIEKGCQVVSISLGVPFIPWLGRNHMGLASDAAYEAGVIVVAAGGQVVDSVCYPAKFNRTVGVGGVTAERRVWFGYRAGRDEIDVWAPARDVLRAESLAPSGAATLPPFEGADPGAQTLSGRSDGSAEGHGGRAQEELRMPERHVARLRRGPRDAPSIRAETDVRRWGGSGRCGGIANRRSRSKGAPPGRRRRGNEFVMHEGGRHGG